MAAMLTCTGVFILAHGKPPPIVCECLTLTSIGVFIPNRNRAAKKFYTENNNLIYLNRM